MSPVTHYRWSSCTNGYMTLLDVQSVTWDEYTTSLNTALSFCFRNVQTSVIVWHNESSDTSIGNRLISWVINLNNWASKDKAKRASIDFSLAEPDNDNNNNNNTGLGFIYCFVMTASFLFKAIDFVICGVCVSLGPIWCLSQQWHD